MSGRETNSGTNSENQIRFESSSPSDSIISNPNSYHLGEQGSDTKNKCLSSAGVLCPRVLLQWEKGLLPQPPTAGLGMRCEVTPWEARKALVIWERREFQAQGPLWGRKTGSARNAVFLEAEYLCPKPPQVFYLFIYCSSFESEKSICFYFSLIFFFSLSLMKMTF